MFYLYVDLLLGLGAGDGALYQQAKYKKQDGYSQVFTLALRVGFWFAAFGGAAPKTSREGEGGFAAELSMRCSST